MKVGGQNINFRQLAKANLVRCEKSFHKCDDWTPMDWACALGGEAGEVLNLLKKVRRGDKTTFDKGVEVPLNADTIGEEIADVVIYADLLATRLGLSLGDLVRFKFNKVSKRIGSKVEL